MPYRVISTKRIEKQLDALPAPLFRRINRAILDLRDTPRPAGVKKMHGSAATYRIRVGNYRIVYGIDDAAQEVRLKHVDHRKDVYRP